MDVREAVADILERGEGRYLVMGMNQAAGCGLRALAREVGIPVEALATMEIEGFGRKAYEPVVEKLAAWIEERGLDPEELVKAGKARFLLEYEPWEVLRDLDDESLREKVEGEHPARMDLRTLLEVAEAVGL